MDSNLNSFIPKPPSQTPEPAVNNMGGSRKKVLIFAGAVILIAGGIYFILGRENKVPLPTALKSAEERGTFIGIVSDIDGVGFGVSAKSSAGEEKKYFSVSKDTIFHTVDLNKNPPQESPVVFSQVKVWDGAVVEFLTKDKVTEALDVKLPIFPKPSPKDNLKNYHPAVPPGSDNTTKPQPQSSIFDLAPVAQANHLGGPDNIYNVHMNGYITASGSGTSPSGYIKVTTSLSNNYTNYYWGMWLYGTVSSRSPQSAWVMGYGTAQSASFDNYSLGAGTYDVGGDAQMWWWNGSNWVYWATLSAKANPDKITINPPSPPANAVITATGPDGTVAGGPNPLYLNPGEAATIKWNIDGATSGCVIDECPSGPDTSSPYSCNNVKVPTGQGSTGALSSGPHTYTTSACNGSIGAPGTVAVKVKTTCSPSSQNAITGQPVTFNASGGNGTSYTWKENGSSVGSGSSLVRTYSTTGTRTLVSSSDGTNSTNCTVDVYQAPTVDLKVNNKNSDTITTGQSATLSWSVSGATYCTATGNWSGNKSVISGSSESTGVFNTPGSYGYALTCGNPGGSATSNTVSVNVTPPPFDYTLSNDGDITVLPAQNGSNTIFNTVNSGSGTVTFSASGFPSGASGSFNLASCNQNCFNTLTISTLTSTPPGTYPITVTGSPLGKTTKFNLIVNQAFDFSMSNDGNKSVTQGGSITSLIIATKTSGNTQSVSFSTVNLPGGMTSSFSPISCNSTCSSTLTINTGTAAPGQYTITVNGASAGLSNKQTQFTLIVNAAFDYSLSNSGNTSVIKPNSVSATITVTKLSGTARSVSFAASGLPTGISGGGATASFSPGSCTPTGASTSCTTTLTISTTPNTNIGPFTITVTGSPLSRATSFVLTVYQASMTVSPSTANAMVDQNQQFKAYYDPDGSAGPQPSQEVTTSSNWSSDNTQKATVNNTTQKGLATGKSPTNGVNITVVYNGSSAVGALSVTSQPTLTCSPMSQTALTGQTVSFTATGGTGNYQWSAPGGSPDTGGGNGQNVFSTKFNTTGAKTVTVSSGSSQQEDCVVTVSNMTVSLSLSPSTGVSPQSVSLMATLGQTLSGTKNYTFWWNCNDTTNSVSAAITACGDPNDSAKGAKFDGVSDNSKTVSHTYSCASGSCTYKPKVITEWGNTTSAQDIQTETINSQNLSVSLTGNPNNGSSPLNTTLTASVASNITGKTTNYTFWWSCSQSGTNVTQVAQVCGDPTNPALGAKFDGISADQKQVSHAYNYPPSGFAAKVIVERDTKAAEGKDDTIGVTPPHNDPPTVTPQSPQAPADYCAAPFGWTLSWIYSDPQGDAQAAYQIIIKDTSSGSTIKDTGQVNSSSNSYAIPIGTLDFNKTYSWTVKVWDNNSFSQMSSGMVAGSNFTTIKHAAPAVNFSWSPLSPAKDEQITFTDKTTLSGGATAASWLWNFPGDATVLSSLNGQQAVAKFSISGSKAITVTVTDSDSLVCSKSTNPVSFPFKIGRGIPSFKEVIPK